MTHTTIAANFDQPLDIHRGFTSEIALNFNIVVDILSEFGDIAFIKIANADIRIDAGWKR